MCNQMKLLMPMTIWSSDTSLPCVKWEVLSSTQRKPSCVVKKGWRCLWTKKHYKRCKGLYNKFSSSRPQELKVAYVFAYWKNMNCEVSYVIAYWKNMNSEVACVCQRENCIASLLLLQKTLPGKAWKHRILASLFVHISTDMHPSW